MAMKVVRVVFLVFGVLLVLYSLVLLIMSGEFYRSDNMLGSASLFAAAGIVAILFAILARRMGR
jgi:hypothetical protein